MSPLTQGLNYRSACDVVLLRITIKIETVIGACYRSPSVTDTENASLLNMVNKVSVK